MADQKQPVVALVIKCWPDGALSVEGPIADKVFCLAMLNNAIDAVRNHGRPNAPLVVPPKDVSIEPADPTLVRP